MLVHLHPSEPEDDLNPSQRQAVMHGDGPLLIIAGAGSGKTKTLVHRVARLVEAGTPPNQILLLTFTRKSSQEMLRRATLLLDHRCQNVSGGTFHAFASAVLRRFAGRLGYTDQFTILDRSDAEDVVQLVRKEPKFADMGKRFPKKNTLADIFSKVRNMQSRIPEVVGKSYPHFFEFSEQIGEMFETYQLFKKSMQAMDYDDLLIELLTLFQTAPDIAKALQNQYQHVMIDEYQDTNGIQAEIMKFLANDRRNICVVGDDAQSIYSFRGANFKNIMEFPALFPGTKMVTLEQNYRSTQPILDLTNAIIAKARERYAKDLFTQKEGGEKPVLVETDSEATQSKFIVQKILEFHENGIALNQMAVLMRSGWHSNDLEVALQAHSIPFVKMGGFKFIELAHVKDVISFLRIMNNPLDRISWQRLLLLLEGVGPKTADTIWSKINSALQAGLIPDPSFFTGKAFSEPLAKLLACIFDHPNPKISPVHAIERVLDTYKPLFKQRYEDFHKRQADLTSIQTIAERYTTLEDFLTEMSLEPPDGSQVGAEAKSQDEPPLTLSTIHSAKGLEWKVVFLISALDGYLPSMQALDDFGQIEEERRLMYVALTRAKDYLFVVKPHLDWNSPQAYRNPGVRFSKVSRFLAEGHLTDQFMDKWVIAERRQPKGRFGLESLPDLDSGYEPQDDVPKYVL